MLAIGGANPDCAQARRVPLRYSCARLRELREPRPPERKCGRGVVKGDRWDTKAWGPKSSMRAQTF